jgi:alanine racemase
VRITWVEIDLAAIRHNLSVIRARIFPAKIIAVVKANAYGHGIIQIAQEAIHAGADYLGVGFLEEGIVLRRKNITTPVLVLGGVLFRQVKTFLANDLDITVSSLGLAYVVNNEARRYGTKARVHLKFDTGLNRIGISYRKAAQVFERLQPLKNIEIVGIYSHFSTADEESPEFTKLQTNRFSDILELALSYNIHPTYKHIACSGAILNYPETTFNMIRVGLAMYGLYPSNQAKRTLDLKPVMTFKSRIVFIKDVDEGEPISYGRTYYTQQKTKIATVPVGYGDGYNRKLSNKGFGLIHGRRYPVVGTVCMDQIMMEIGANSSIRVGDEVVLYGKQGNQQVTVEEVAGWVGTIPYEITCLITRRVPRVFINPST